MAPPAKSRKGKKAWRKNIDASEVEAFLEEQTYQERRGPAAKELKDDQLFFVDTTADADGAAAVADGRRPAKRRREEAAAKPLRAQQIIAEVHKTKPLALAPPPRKTAAAAAAASGADSTGKTAVSTNGRKPAGRKGFALHPLDIWGDEDMGLTAGAAAKQHPHQHQQQEEKDEKSKVGKKARKAAALEPAAAAAAAAVAVRALGPSVKALRRSPPPPRVAAVAVDVPGCSFNPDGEQHQDALALLVASEMRKQLRKELLPSAPPEEVEADWRKGRPLTELEALQEEAASSEDEEEEVAKAGNGAAKSIAVAAVTAAVAAVADPNAIPLGADEEGDGGGDEGDGEGLENGGGESVLGKWSRKSEKKSRKDRNKEARRKAAEAEAEERRRLKAQRRQLQSLQEVEAQLKEEEQDKEVRWLRRAAMLQERAAVQPPRLGKLKFEPPSVQVLTSDEKTGSLRRVVPCAMLAADRFKSLQQRGLLEPRKPQPFKEKRRKVTYEKGARFERAVEASAEVRDLSHRNKKARRQAKAAAAKAGSEEDWL